MTTQVEFFESLERAGRGQEGAREDTEMSPKASCHPWSSSESKGPAFPTFFVLPCPTLASVPSSHFFPHLSREDVLSLPPSCLSHWRAATWSLDAPLD